jgi:hypothetical protein
MRASPVFSFSIEQPIIVLQPVWPWQVDQLMWRISFLSAIFVLQSAFATPAERIKRKPPNETEAARIASEQALNDENLQRGDIVSTDRGFFEFRGVSQGGGFNFARIPNPLLVK